MSKSIIEKLGITPTGWEMTMGHIGSRIEPFVSCDKRTMDGMHIHNGKTKEEQKANAILIASAPEMLEALIISIKHDHNYFDGFFIDWSMDNLEHLVLSKWGENGREVYTDFIRSISAIEKATGKTWEEIKELIK